MDIMGKGFRTIGDKLLVKLTTMPEMNAKVFSETGDEIGKVVDIIGPAKAPFALVLGKDVKEFEGKAVACE